MKTFWLKFNISNRELSSEMFLSGKADKDRGGITFPKRHQEKLEGRTAKRGLLGVFVSISVTTMRL